MVEVDREGGASWLWNWFLRKLIFYLSRVNYCAKPDAKSVSSSLSVLGTTRFMRCS